MPAPNSFRLHHNEGVSSVALYENDDDEVCICFSKATNLYFINYNANYPIFVMDKNLAHNLYLAMKNMFGEKLMGKNVETNRRVMKYKVFSLQLGVEPEISMNSMLEAGWQPYGEHSTVVAGVGVVIFIQVLVRYE